MYIIRLLSPEGENFYFPAGFGISTDELTRAIDEAATFKTADQARARLQAHVSPPAFWEHEQAHRRAMQRKWRGWRFFYMEVRGPLIEGSAL